MSDKAVVRVVKEIADIQKGRDLSIAVACREQNVKDVKALIVGPHGTPYEYGFFDFDIKPDNNYPESPPAVSCRTTNDNRTRLNPNIYAGGKVCLSILGTWRGEPGEQWSSAQGLESILVSIQSLMSTNPYENEPGFESPTRPNDKENAEAYAAKITHESIRISVIMRLESYLQIYPGGTFGIPLTSMVNDDKQTGDDSSRPFEPFQDLVKRRFLWYYDTYMQTVAKGLEKHVAGSSFKIMPFEAPKNEMRGAFHYEDLEKRLRNIHRALEAEAQRWTKEGGDHVTRDTPIALSMRNIFARVIEEFKNSSSVTLDIDLKEKNNPFLWSITYYGRPMTHLDGGMFSILLYISPRFPDEQPRCRFETPIFHHRVAKDGTLCYLPEREDDLRSHVEAIVRTIEDEHPPYDPRTLVNPESCKLFWGTPDDKKQYNRLLRRAVQRSTEM